MTLYGVDDVSVGQLVSIYGDLIHDVSVGHRLVSIYGDMIHDVSVGQLGSIYGDLVDVHIWRSDP